MNIGDYVEVDIGMGLLAKGQIITDSDYVGALAMQRSQHHQHSLAGTKSSGFHGIKRTPTSHRIKFLDGSTHTAMTEECRKIEEKDVFVMKLKGDEEMAKIYVALDERT